MTFRTLLAALLALPAFANAGVSIQNGDFFITYQDITQEAGPHALNLTRTYNSLAPERGWFGYGWGSPFETRLVVMPDGSAAVRENGTGITNYYRPAGTTDITGGIEKIVAAVSARDKLSPEAAAALRNTLARDELQRVRKVLSYGVQSALPAGTTVRANMCAQALVARIAEGYKRTRCDNEGTDIFDQRGRLLSHESAEGQRYTVRYEGDNPTVIEDNHGQSLRFTWTADGLLASAAGGKHKINFSYDTNKNLVLADDPDSQSYRYDYDTNHNLTRIRYIDDSSRQIAYVSAETGFVQSVTERNGEKTEYAYRADPQDAQHTWTTVTRIAASGQKASREYEFKREITSTGAEQIASIGTSTATRNGERKTETRLDDKGRVVHRRTANGDEMDYVYHPRTDKLILVFNRGAVTEYHYGASGNLTQASDSTGKVIDLDYSGELIQRMVETNAAGGPRRDLRFKYNPAGKPVEINMAGVGVINVDYTDAGEIRNVASKQGAVIALKVTQAFQSLLSMVQPAGARLGM